ncbi:hypothetical protein BO71DRAFT_373978 [Aspergillus ellipticus CBS 707.79]|uniref:Endoplasmic reticulum-based factor for assembly of V-ATPase n=1 Tax=Aspergillus ellipticus CBS 707.79 TaxID=1448320 RepID=A0A319DHP5_9EURO|nr:hypothetical protein BO71DRAFT_373978 [Aspergillus ellipticus CBS 707.79]
MVLLVTTSPILAAFEALPASSRHDLELPDSLSLQDPISHAQLIALARYFKTCPETSISDPRSRSLSLNSLLRGTKVYVPPPPKKPEPTPEYLALKARLLAAAETDAYNRMTSSTSLSTPKPTSNAIFTTTTPTLSALHDEKGGPDTEDTLTPSLVLNIFLSVLITGFSVYWMLKSFQTPEMMVSAVAGAWSGKRTRGGDGVSEAVKVLVSLVAALGVGVAEVAIYAIYLGKVEEAKGKERRRRERKVVVGSERVGGGVFEGEERKVDDGEGEKEEIWGRGPNRGLRRRVREKWEEKEKGKE